MSPKINTVNPAASKSERCVLPSISCSASRETGDAAFCSSLLVDHFFSHRYLLSIGGWRITTTGAHNGVSDASTGLRQGSNWPAQLRRWKPLRPRQVPRLVGRPAELCSREGIFFQRLNIFHLFARSLRSFRAVKCFVHIGRTLGGQICVRINRWEFLSWLVNQAWLESSGRVMK